MLRSLLAAALLIVAVAVPANAAKPLRGVTATVTTDASVIHAGDVVTFTATSNADWWRLDVKCFQGDLLVLAGGGHYFPAGTGSQTYGMSSGAYQNNPIGAECRVQVATWKGYDKGYNGDVLIPEPLLFTLLP